MRLFAHLTRYWPNLLASALALGACALLWRVRDSALEFGTIGYIDGLSAFFALALFGGSALVPRHAVSVRWWRAAATVIVLALAYSTALIPMIAACYLLFALLMLERAPVAAPAMASARARPLRHAVGLLRRAANAAPGLLAAGCLLAGYGALALRGAIRYDDRTAGAALDSFVFWFVLLAAITPLVPFARTKNQEQAPARSIENTTPNSEASISNLPSTLLSFQLYRFAWLYPLARLYSLGPWNNGWAFATLLLGGAVALWCASSALSQSHATERSQHIGMIYLALGLAGFGLGTSAGIAAGCFGILTYLVLVTGQIDWSLDARFEPHVSGVSRQESEMLEHGDDEGRSPCSSILPWLISSALPFTAPFVAAWMLMGAAVAGGVALLAGVAWLAALLHALTFALWGAPDAARGRRARQIAGVISIMLGVGAPLIVRWAIQPIVAQLQGGLTPYGDINIWPWVGLAASDSAHTQVTTLPSIAIALLMLVLSALVYLVARLREIRNTDRSVDGSVEKPQEPTVASGIATEIGTVLHSLRDEVPWLGGLLGADPRDQRRHGDDE